MTTEIDQRLQEVRARFNAAVADNPTAEAELEWADHDYEDMGFVLDLVADLRSRLACVVEATYWDRPYDERIAAIRGMCDLTSDGLSPAEVDEHKRTGWLLYNELVDRWNVERLHFQAVIAELKELLTRACSADAGEDCRFDHHGDCQAHGPWGDGRPCPYPLIRQYLTTPVQPSGGAS